MTSERNLDLTNAPMSGSSKHRHHPLRFNVLSRWPVYALVGAFCLYRLAVFRPQPLDSPGTLRPILNKWFIAFLRLYEYPEPAYAHWKTFCFFLLLVPPTLAVLNFAREHKMFNLPNRAAGIFCSRTLLFAGIALVLIACRYPSLLNYELNPDEGGYVAAAHKLFYDGNFFRSVDCGTSGPFNVYPLMLPAIVGISPDFASGRFLVLIIVFSIIYLLYRTIALLASDHLARIAILPAVAAFAVFKNPNLIHYSSEHTPVLLVSAALYTSVRVLRDPASYRIPLFLVGLLTSFAFFSKMQSVPIFAVFAFVSVAYTHATGHADKFWRPSLLFAAGTLPLLFLNAALCLTGGVWKDFWMSYIVANQHYSDLESDFFTALPRFVQYMLGTGEVRFFLFTFLALVLAYAVQKMRRNAAGDQSTLLQLTGISAVVIAIAVILHSSEASAIYPYLSLMTIFTVPVYFLLFCKAGRFGTDPVRWFGLIASMSLLAALFSIYKPHRDFPHYLLFLFTPVCAVMAWMLIRQTENSGPADTKDVVEDQHRFQPSEQPAFLLLFVVLTVTYQSYLWGAQNDRVFKDVVPTIRPLEGDFIRSLTGPNGRIVVWGWSADPYLGSGRVVATRDLNMLDFFAAPDVAAYYRARFLRDLRRHPAEVFIDVVGPNSWAFWDRKLYNFEQFPEIASFVETNYLHLTDAYEHRYFLRRDLVSRARSVRMPKVCTTRALRCVGMPAHIISEGATVLIVQNLPAIEMPAHALIEAEFTPMASQTANATIFNNEAAPHSFRGFRFQSIGGDRYRLLLGLGESWAFSKSILLPQGKLASLSVELDGMNVYIRCNGVAVDDMRLSSPMADAPGPITVGSWIDGQCRFTGTIQFFQILDLEEAE